MLHSYLYDEYLPKAKETIMRIYMLKSVIANTDYSFNFIESGDREGIFSLRKSVWPHVNICIFCYEVENYISFKNIKDKVNKNLVKSSLFVNFHELALASVNVNEYSQITFVISRNCKVKFASKLMELAGKYFLNTVLPR